MKTRTTVIVTLLAASTAGVIGFLAFLYSGIYDIAARHPHARLTELVLTTLMRRSVEFQARDLQVPPLDREHLVKRGFILYRRYCIACHGSPGEARSRMGIGLNPDPPPLERTAERWSAAETAWIVANGLKMAGMPAFGLGEDPDDLWAIVAFVHRMNTLSPAEYRVMRAAIDGEIPAEEVPWIAPDQGWSELRERGDAARGAELLDEYGCGACHRIPGIAGARSAVGPPLNGWSQRHFIAGSLVNTPNNLVAWIRNPEQVEPGTAMPNLGVSEAQAWDMAGYLYQIGDG